MKTFEEYFATFPPSTQDRLRRINTLIIEQASGAEACFSYGMPGYKTYGRPLVYFAAYANHLGFYATPKGHAAFAQALGGYKQGKGSVQFPLTQPLPEDLIRRMVSFRVAENEQKFAG